MTLKELREKRKKAEERRVAAKEAADAIIADADQNGGAMTEDQTTRLSAAEAEYESARTALAAIDRAIERESHPATASGAAAGRQGDAGDSTIEVIGDREDPRGGFRSLAHFAHDVRAHAMNQRCSEAFQQWVARPSAAATSPHNEGVGVDGGFEVPIDYRTNIWRLIFDESDVLAQFMFEPTSSNQVSLLKDESTPWGSRGIKAYWRGESGAMTSTKTYREPLLTRLNELYAFTSATNELLEDLPSLNSRLTIDSAAAIRYKLLEAIIEGNGVGAPLGYFASGAKVSVAKESGQAADTIVAANIAKMFSRLLDGPKSFWLMNQDCIPQLVVMTISNQPIWTPPNSGFKEAPGGFLFGKPIKFSEHCDTVGDQGDIHLVNPDGMFLTNKANGITFDSSIHLYFDTNETAFRWTFRVGGRPYLSAPITPKNSSNTLSHFVVLDARA